MNEQIENMIKNLFRSGCERTLGPDDFVDICRAMRVAKLYYVLDFGVGRYRDPATGKLVISGNEEGDGRIYLYDSDMEGGLCRQFQYYINGMPAVLTGVQLLKEVSEEEIDEELYHNLSDMMYILISRQNLLAMVDFAENRDMLTGISSGGHMAKIFLGLAKEGRANDYAIVFSNIQNFKYVNESRGSKCGDEVLVRFAHKMVEFVRPDGYVGRMGGDNFTYIIPTGRVEELVERLRCMSFGNLQNAPGKKIDISCWIGISMPTVGEERHFKERLEDASVSCNMGKKVLKKPVVYYSEGLKQMLKWNMKVVAMFFPAIKNHELIPFFHAKVDMRTGVLVGFEALCRWIHDGNFIYPDQFIPILDKEGLIHDVDITIFRETCLAIKRWKEMGLTPPRISSNFSRKNLFVPDIERQILDVIKECGIEVDDVEIEITESVQDHEYGRLIEFINILHSAGVHIAVDDFGTGYSSLSLIHNIDADVIKIDKSFVDELAENEKSFVLIESVIGIARHLNMEVVAEGVETREQGQKLLELGCEIAQGYYYSKPVSFDDATALIIDPPFEPV